MAVSTVMSTGMQREKLATERKETSIRKERQTGLRCRCSFLQESSPDGMTGYTISWCPLDQQVAASLLQCTAAC